MQLNSKTRKLTYLAMFAAISSVLMYIPEFPLPFLPPFLKIDLSGIPILLAAFMFGPLEGIAVTLIKDIAHLFGSTSGGIGELSDFIIYTSFILVAFLVYRTNKTKKSAVLACAAGTATILITGSLSNKYLIIPFYEKIMPIDAIIQACKAVNPYIDSINAYVLFGVVPFNFIKGTIISIVTLLVYKRLSVLIKGRITV